MNVTLLENVISQGNDVHRPQQLVPPLLRQVTAEYLVIIIINIKSQF